MLKEPEQECIEPSVVVVVDDWRIETRNRLIAEKTRRIEAEEKRKKDELIKNRPSFEKEAKELLVEISCYDPSDKWQYRKGLRLMYLGTKLGNQDYKEAGHQFYMMSTEEMSTG